MAVERDEVDARWRDHLKDEEKQRLDLIEERVARRIEVVSWDQAEKRKIMARAIARMRRKEGRQK